MNNLKLSHTTMIANTRGFAACAVAAGMLLISACGGGQTTTTTTTTEATGPTTVTESPQRGGRHDATPVETGPTPEEIAARRAAEARAALDQAAELYDAGSVGNRPYDRIAQLLNSSLEVNPQQAEAWFNLGLLNHEQGDTQAAIEAYEQAGSVDRYFARGLANIGMIQLEQGDEAAARATFRQCIERSQIEPGCNINLTVLEMRANAGRPATEEQSQQWINRLRFALGGDAMNANAYANLSRVYFELGRVELARLVCETAILQQIDDAVLHNQLGLIALAEDDVIAAYGEFQAAVQRDPNYLDAHMNIGAMALSLRDHATAKASFETVLAQDPDNLDARLAYGVALRGVEDFDGAAREYNAVLAAQPQNSDAIFNLGVLNQEFLQNYDAALEYYRQYQSVAPTGAHAESVAQRITVISDLLEFMDEGGM